MKSDKLLEAMGISGTEIKRRKTQSLKAKNSETYISSKNKRKRRSNRRKNG